MRRVCPAFILSELGTIIALFVLFIGIARCGVTVGLGVEAPPGVGAWLFRPAPAPALVAAA